MSTYVLDPPPTVQEFSGPAREVLRAYYASNDLDIESATDREKILALQIQLGRMNFSAYGGGETDAMETRALEHVLLTEKGIDV